MVNNKGLCYLELVTLKKLWESANSVQKEKILGFNHKKNNTGIPPVTTEVNNIA